MRGLALLCLLLPGRASAESWHQTISPHFEVFHEAAFAPQGFVLQLEHMHNRLRMDMALFAPWMAKERIRVYLYSGRKGYLRGKFQPPSWSNGIADYQKREIVTYEQEGGIKKLMEVISHEMTHLLFEGYWGEEKRSPPVWLNEGLAMAEEADNAQRAENSPWYQAMAYLNAGNVIRLKQFIQITPSRDLKDNSVVTLWYVEAYSITYFLFRQHTRLQFFNFCATLREGRPLEYALWKVYRYQSLEKLEAEWMRWLKLPEVRTRFQPLKKEAPDADARQRKGKKGKSLRPMNFSDFSFHGLIPDK